MLYYFVSPYVFEQAMMSLKCYWDILHAKISTLLAKDQKADHVPISVAALIFSETAAILLEWLLSSQFFSEHNVLFASTD